jgi:hypothetical protein
MPELNEAFVRQQQSPKPRAAKERVTLSSLILRGESGLETKPNSLTRYVNQGREGE